MPHQIEVRAVLFALVALSLTASARAATVLRIGGNGSAMPIAAALVEASAQVRPVVVAHFGTNGALKALKAATIDIAVAERSLNFDETQAGLAASPLSRTAIVFATHPGIPVHSVTLAQAMKLYAADQTTWPDGSRVRPILRPWTGTESANLSAISPDFAVAVLHAHDVKGLRTAVTGEDAINAIATTPGAFGTTTLAMLTLHPSKINVLALDGVAPTQETLSKGLYKLTATFYLAYRSPAAPQVQQLLDFTSSERGRDIIIRYGQIPATPGNR